MGELADPPGSGPGAFQVRSLVPQLGRRARLRPRPRQAGGPGRHRVAAPGARTPPARTPAGREAGPRCRMLRVRLPPSALPGWVWLPELAGLHRRAATPPGRAGWVPPGITRGQPLALRAGALCSSVGNGRPVRHRGRALYVYSSCGCSSGEEHGVAIAEVPGSSPGIRSQGALGQLAEPARPDRV